MDYENLTLNRGGGSAVAGAVNVNVNVIGSTNSNVELETDGNMCGSQEMLEVKSKDKARRYWTPSEEEHLYEIWGRDNWRLTRNGKNTIYFGQWSEELRERFSVDVKPEEIQMKVNQTRAKFRQVKKQLQSDPNCYAMRWKKYDIINRILKNNYRPTDAEPLPPEALLNNRDVSPPRDDEQQHQQPQEQQKTQQQQQSGLNLSVVESTPNHFYSSNNNNNSNSNNSNSHAQSTNNNNNNNNTMSFNTELFTDQYDDIKQEYDEEEYRSMSFQEQMTQYSPAESAQLLELQTPQQQQQQQHQQQHQQHHQQQQQQFQAGGYEGSVVSYAAAPQAPQQQAPHYSNNSVASTSTINNQPITAVAYINSTNNTISVATNSSNGGAIAVPMQPPVAATSSGAGLGAGSSSQSTVAMPTPTPRKRGRPFGSSNLPSADSLESLFMEEVRRKNQLLAEQTKISRLRLELEERKIELMQTFFPKFLEQQTHILSQIMQIPHFQQQQQQQPPPRQ